ncbi:MAG: D-alanyl-D-alanine carboxypeptidase [Candidatus Parcubacteria bacterium]|nr:D-alanyl-D-alanine carboxypeptidase [Candidatus Parcubacteria bacterium]
MTMYPTRNVAAFLLACIAFIGIASALKISQTIGSLTPKLAPPSKEQQIPSADESFLPAATPKPAPQVPKAPSDPVTADAYVVGDVQTGKIYFQKNPKLVLPFASMSKLITAFAATDMLASGTPITITEAETQVPADASALKAGEKFTLSELLYPMLLNSSNVAAEAIASSSERGNFLEQMRGYAWEVGMPNSYFADPTGLSPKNAGTADGFFALAQYLYAKRPDILALTRTVSSSIGTTSDHGAHTFTSIHPFVTDPRFLGGKTGHTSAALDTMITIMNIQNHPIAIIILHSSQGRAKDTQLLIDRVEKVIAQ